MHLLLLLLRGARGLTAHEAVDLGLVRGVANFSTAMEALKDMHGYSFTVVATHEPKGGGVGRKQYRWIATARYLWNGSVAEDYALARLKRRVA